MRTEGDVTKGGAVDADKALATDHDPHEKILAEGMKTCP